MDVVKEKKPPVWFTKLRLFLVIVAVAIGWYVFTNKSSSMLEIKRTDILVAKVQHGQLDVVIDGYGTLKSNKQQLITALTRATVKNIFIKPGNIVRKGNVIVELDNPELSQLAENASQQLAQERANLRKLKLNQQRELLTEQANIADLTAQLESATLYRVAQQSLLSDGTVSALTFKESQLKEQQLTKRIALMKRRLAQLADVHLEAENIQQQQIMRQQGQVDIALSRLARLQVKADFDGVLQRVPVELGQSLSPGQEVALVGSVTDLVALIRVPQLQAQQIELGQQAIIDTRRDKISGSVIRIDPLVENNTVTIEIGLPSNLPASARPQLNVDGQVITAQLNNAFYIQRPANIRSRSNAQLYLLNTQTNVAQLTSISFGQQAGRFIEITSAVEPNQEFIVSDLSNLTDSHTHLSIN